MFPNASTHYLNEDDAHSSGVHRSVKLEQPRAAAVAVLDHATAAASAFGPLASKQEYGAGVGVGVNAGFGKSHLHAFQSTLSVAQKHIDDSLTTEFCPPVCPDYLEISNYPSNLRLSVIVDAIKAACKQQQIDCTFVCSANEYAAHCLGYEGSAGVSFCVNLFLNDKVDSTQYILEFQRRKGDCFAYASISGNLRDELSSRGIIKSQDTFCSFKPGPPLPGFEVTDEEQLEFFKQLMEMSTSPFLEVQVDALSCMFDMSKESNNHAMMLSEGVLEPLFRGISSPEECVHRVAASTLANLLEKLLGNEALLREDSPVFQTIKQSLANGGFNTLVSLLRSDTLQVIRESARAILNAHYTLGNRVPLQLPVDTVSSLSEYEDDRIRDCYQNLMPLAH